jgi:hypothetical protein
MKYTVAKIIYLERILLMIALIVFFLIIANIYSKIFFFVMGSLVFLNCLYNMGSFFFIDSHVIKIVHPLMATEIIKLNKIRRIFTKEYFVGTEAQEKRYKIYLEYMNDVNIVNQSSDIATFISDSLWIELLKRFDYDFNKDEVERKLPGCSEYKKQVGFMIFLLIGIAIILCFYLFFFK